MKTDVDNNTQAWVNEIPEVEKSSRLFGIILLVAILSLVTLGIYYYQIRPSLSQTIPNHAAQPIDSPPVELTSVILRYDGRELAAEQVVFSEDRLYLAQQDIPAFLVYSRNFELMRVISLEQPKVLHPSAIAINDSFLVVGDSTIGAIVLFDRDGYYFNSVSWYPDKSSPIKPIHLSSSDGFLYATDANLSIAKISLQDRKPFYDLLELLAVQPNSRTADLGVPTCSFATPDGNLWIGDSHNSAGFIIDKSGNQLHRTEAPIKARVAIPVDFILIGEGDEMSPYRIHMLDRVAGKIFVYDLVGKLTLVYPQDRSLNSPHSMTVDETSRHIYVAETGVGKITVFGY